MKILAVSQRVRNLDTLPRAENVRDIGKSTEAISLNEIVKDIMASSNKVTVIYADDRSRKYFAKPPHKWYLQSPFNPAHQTHQYRSQKQLERTKNKKIGKTAS